MADGKMRILVLGASGMLGSTMFRALSKVSRFDVFGSVRDVEYKQYFEPGLYDKLIHAGELNSETGLIEALESSKPNLIINCVGIIKQLPYANDHFESLSINSILPHRLIKYCDATDAKLIHFSTDCVFSGKTGFYKEDDFADANDLYGRSKFLGEVVSKNCVTLRTSIIGHELNSKKSLIDWFLNQSIEVKGYTKAVFSGLPTIEVARIVRDYIIPSPNLFGLYHLSVEPINKFDLLNLVAKVYGKDIKIIPDNKLVIDRSLNSERFRYDTGFRPKPWSELIKIMHKEYLRIP